MEKSRLEAFSDGVFAIIITIMVLGLDAPDQVTFAAICTRLPAFLTYVLSFVYVAIFWINHHLLLSATRRINTGVLWANINFLFWISLVPFFTAWVDEHHAAPVPVAAYGVIFLACVASYRLLERILFKTHDSTAPIVQILRPGRREKVSIVAFIVAILMSAVHPFISLVIYIIIAGFWIVPDRRLVRAVMDMEK